MDLPEKVIVLAIDTSWSLALNGLFEAIKSAATAIDSLVADIHPDHVLLPLTYSAFARPIERRMIAGLPFDDSVLGMNLHHALLLAREMLFGYRGGKRRVLVLGDADVTAHLERGKSYFAYPPSAVTLDATVSAARECRDEQIRVTLLALNCNYYTRQFGERLSDEAAVEFIPCDAESLTAEALAAYER